MIEYEKKRVLKEIVSKVTCDKCGCAVRLERDSDIDYSLVFHSSMMDAPGRHFVHNYGYGTEHDLHTLNVTLCDNCIADVLGVYGNTINNC